MTFPENFVEILQVGSTEECIAILTNFNSKNEKAKDFPDVKLEVKTKLWDAITARLESPTTPPDLLRLLLGTLRILSREKPTLEYLVGDRLLIILLKIAGLKETTDYQNCSHSETLESLKVIFNMIYQSSVIQTMLIENRLLQGLTEAIREFRNNSQLLPEVKFFTMRVLFMITALCQQTGPKVREELKGIVYITDFLEEQTKTSEPYDDVTVDLICESLKVLYNIIHDIVPNKNEVNSRVIDEEDLKHLVKITQLVRKFLLHPAVSEEKKLELNSHSIDLLAAVSCECFQELIPKQDSDSQYQLEEHDMSAIEAIADFLHHRLDSIESTRSPTQYLSPVLCVLLSMVRSNRLIRKYLKKRILPPLQKTDLIERPEVGSTLRNKLCALLTSAGNITEVVASILFIICKENVKRMIKYTGYGNAAGLLANKGLLLGGNGNSQEYSSESDDSDTEEYREVRHLINDVEGWLQPERPPPCEGMTDEQKEYEAVKLVQAIDKLNRSSIIQTCRISADGRPEPLEHILQLQEQCAQNSSFPSQSQNHNNSDSDED